MTQDPTAWFGHAPRPRWVPYASAMFVAAMLAVIAWAIFDGLRAIEVGAGTLLVLIPPQLGHDLVLRRFRIRNRRRDRTFSPGASEHLYSTMDAWLGIGSPGAGIVASCLPIGLFALIGHGPLLVIAMISLGVNAMSLLLAPWDEQNRPMVPISFWLWLPGLVTQCAVASWALGVAGSPWGLWSLLLVLLHLLRLRLLLADRERRSHDRADRRGSRSWVILHVAAWLALGFGMAYCIAAPLN